MSNESPINPADEIDEADKVPVGEKIGYGLGDTASNLYWKLFENFQMFFYTNVFGLDPGKAGTMLFVTKIWDAFNDPMIGYLADRTRTAWGRFRPYLIWMIVPFVVSGILTFYTPDLSENGKLIYAYVTYTLVFMAYTAINIPYGALMGVISPSSKERTSVSTYRFVLAFCGGLIVQKFTEPLVLFFGGSKTEVVDGKEVMLPVDPQAGFFWTVVVYACLAAVLFIICFLTTKERVKPKVEVNKTFSNDVSDLIRNRPWLVLLVVGLFQILAGWTRGTATAYYFTYFVREQFGNFLVAGTIAGICGMLTTGLWTRYFSKKQLMVGMNLAQAALTAVYVSLSSDQTTLIYGLHILASFIVGPVPILLWSMYADVADYSEWKNHRRATGLVFAAATFAQKMGGALGGAIPGWCLAYYGFQKPEKTNEFMEQSERTLEGIVLMMSLIPAFFLTVGAIAMLFYNIDAKLLRQIEMDLAKRRLKSKENENESGETSEANSGES